MDVDVPATGQKVGGLGVSQRRRARERARIGRNRHRDPAVLARFGRAMHQRRAGWRFRGTRRRGTAVTGCETTKPVRTATLNVRRYEEARANTAMIIYDSFAASQILSTTPTTAGTVQRVLPCPLVSETAAHDRNIARSPDCRPVAAAKSTPRDSTAAKWRPEAPQPPRKKRPRNVRPRHRSSKTLPSERYRCSWRPFVKLSRQSPRKS
jgi:hypothetical protein